MRTIRDIFTTYAPEYLERSPHLPASPHQAMDAICRCRTGAYGYSLSAGARCRQHPDIAHACGHRHCPPCQHQKAAQWLHNPLDQQLPGGYCLSTFTVPDALRPLCRAHPRLASQSLFAASAQALKRLAQAPRFLGTTRPGFTGILPTWGRQLHYHPHIHDIVPGGGLSQDREAWLPSRTNFYVPVRALSPLSRALFKPEMRTAGQLAQSDPHVWTTPWNVHSQATPDGATSFTSLAPYVFQVAISHRRIVGLQDRIVTVTSRTPGSTRPRTTRLDALECMRRFRQHVLPAGCMQVRHFGFMHATCRITTDTIRQMITSHTGATLPLEPPRGPATTPAQVPCPHCGAPLIVLSRVWPFSLAIFDTS
jgi:hypothetical protein